MRTRTVPLFRSFRSAAPGLLAAALVWLALPSPAASEDCTGVSPWINEFDYDSNDGGFNNDDDEFVEIAGPTGTDISGYQILAIEGNASFLQCGSGIFGSNGNAYFNAVIPGGTVLGDDTGTGVGFYVVCFEGTSENVLAAGDCDVVLPGVANDSNLKNGDLFPGGNTDCPDGVLMLDASSALRDAISYEGIIPNTGTFGALFNPPNISYNAGEDAGFDAQESVYKTTSSVGRASSASEWQDDGGVGSASPGALNFGQSLSCDAPAPVCGDGSTEGSEECDDGNTAPGDGCSDLCVIEFCGDGTTQPGLGEQCDDGNTAPGDGCSDLCITEFCGDGTTQPGLGEQCDDGNTAPGDGCSDLCITEFCGDGTTQPGLGEQCDDGNTSNGDGCSDSCVSELCGDGVTQGGLGEECDDGGTIPGDGCSEQCLLEVCGDGVVQAGLGEQCDDGNTAPGDGCSDLCISEFCGDGATQTGLGEQCDDGNTAPGDGCSAMCTIEGNVPVPTLGSWTRGWLVLAILAAGWLALARHRSRTA